MNLRSSRVRLCQTLQMLLLGVLAGCAAIEIDVDVYKGPLSHEEDIQLRQFAALAIAAKPLLISLRDDFEISARRGTQGKSFYEEIEDRKLRKDRFLSDKVVFKSRIARFVNDATLYYEDLGPETLSGTRRAAERVEESLKVFDLSKTDIAIAARIRGAYAGTGWSAERVGFAKAYLNVICGRGASADECAEYPSRPYRYIPELQDACIRLQKAGPALLPCAQESGSNNGFQFLAHHGNAEQHARAIFGEGGDEQFVKRVMELSGAFVEARVATHDVFSNALALLEESSPNSVERVYAARLVAYTVQPRTLACFVTAPGVKQSPQLQSLSHAMRELLQGSQSEPSGLFSTTPINWDANYGQYRRAEAALQQTGQRFPAELARFLRATDAALPQLDRARLRPDAGHPGYASSPLRRCAAVSDAEFKHLGRIHSLDYGLSRGPNEQDFVAVLASMQASLTALEVQDVNGFDRARLPAGIETLTRNFEQALSDSGHDLTAKKVVDARRALEEVLIFFAERTLFTVNNLTKSALELDPAVAATTQDAFGNQYGENKATAAVFVERMAVLETLGNTLVLHANDLRRRQNHREFEERALGSELEAARQSFNPGPGAVFDAMLFKARADLQRSSGSLEVATPAAAAASSAVASLSVELATQRTALAAAERTQAQKREALLPLENLARTTLPSKERKGPLARWSKPSPAQEDKDISDSVAYVKQALQDSPTVTSAKVVEQLSKWLELQTAGSAAETPRTARINSARQGLAERQEALDQAFTTPQGVDAVFAGLRGLVRGWAVEGISELDDISNQLGKKQQDEKLLKERLASAQIKQHTQQVKVTKSTGQKSLLEAALPLLEEQREGVVRDADKLRASDPQTVLVLLKKSLETRRSIKPPDPKAAEIDKTLAFLDTFKPPPVFTLALPKEASNKSRKDVLDQVISNLQHRRIQALAIGDKDQAANLTRALNYAYQARSGAAYLRPSSDYLKNAYSATTFQDGTQPSRRNMLVEWHRNLFSDDFAKKSGEAKEKVEKLFWQNINKVTLNGGGSSNYVLAKDDVGNWYVKAYSSDPSTIIKSAQSLALFNLGGQINTNLLRRVEMQQRLESKDSTAEERAQLRTDLSNTSADTNTGLVKVKDRYAKQYMGAAETTIDNLVQTLQSLPDDIRKAAQKDSNLEGVDFDALAKRLDLIRASELEPAAKSLTDAKGLRADDTTRVTKIESALVDALSAMRRFRQKAYSDLVTNELVSTAPAKRAAAATFAQQQVRDRITSSVTSYRAALANFDNALVNIGDVAFTKD